MKIALVIGTRPEIIKMSSLIRACQRRAIDFFIVHSNQHYSENLDSIFFKELNLPSPNYNLRVGSSAHGNQTGKILIKIEEIFEKEKPTHVLVQGDTNTVLAASLAASKMEISVGHVEAGLRSYNRKMPEETNRIVTDHISDYLFCPTNTQKKILLKEGILEDKIYVVGNTVVDAVFENIALAKEKSKILAKFQLTEKEYILVTAHRSLNVDSKELLQKLISNLDNISLSLGVPIIYPIHPRTKKMLDQFDINPKIISCVDPVGYLDFLFLQQNAKIILTDSGGIQEESCILGTPCVTLREETERPETVEVGANIVSGLGLDDINNAINIQLKSDCSWENPYGDGRTAEKILDILSEE